MQAVRVPAVRPYYLVTEVLKALRSLLAGDLTSGEDVRNLERGFARVMGVPACAAFPGARVGLYRALRSRGFPPDSRVLIAPITPAEMVRAIQRAGLRPVLVDMDPETLFFDTGALERASRRDTAAIVLTYLYGLVPPTLDEVLALARERGLFVVEDVSQALGASLRGRPLGTLGHAGLMSLSSFKVVSSLGGGLVSGAADLVDACRAVSPPATRRPERAPFLVLVAKILAYRGLTSDLGFRAVFPGIRALTSHAPDLLERLRTGDVDLILGRRGASAGAGPPPDSGAEYLDFQARMALSALSRLEEVNRALVEQARVIALSPVVAARLPARHAEGRCVWWRLPVRVSEARSVARRLAARGIETSRNALPICSDVPDLARFVFEGPLLGTRACHEQWLLVPVHADHDARTVAAVRDALEAALQADPAPGRRS